MFEMISNSWVSWQQLDRESPRLTQTRGGSVCSPRLCGLFQKFSLSFSCPKSYDYFSLKVFGQMPCQKTNSRLWVSMIFIERKCLIITKSCLYNTRWIADTFWEKVDFANFHPIIWVERGAFRICASGCQRRLSGARCKSLQNESGESTIGSKIR